MRSLRISNTCLFSHWINVKPITVDDLNGLRQLQVLCTLTIKVWESFATLMTDANFNKVSFLLT
jgi:hypothetical protein